MFRSKMRGQALVEFALILPVFLVLVLGGIDFLWQETMASNFTYVVNQTAICVITPGCPRYLWAKPGVGSPFEFNF